MVDSFKIKTDIFEGPLELLLSLVEKRKLFINDVSLAKVTDDFIAHIKAYDNFPIADSAQFILIASTLLLIKSKSLLPTLQLTQEEQANIEDLETRLKIYQRMKELSVHISDLFGKKILFSRLPTKNVTPVFSPDEQMTMPTISATIWDLLKNLPKKEILPQAIVRKVISLEETITNLTERIKTNLKMSFHQFSGMGREDRVNVIVSFLAMLELVKQGIISVAQEDRFDDINMETTDIGIPSYK